MYGKITREFRRIMTAHLLKVSIGAGVVILLCVVLYWNMRPVTSEQPRHAVGPVIEESVGEGGRPLSKGSAALSGDSEKTSVRSDVLRAEPKAATDWRARRFQNLIDDLTDGEWKIRRGAAAVLKDGEVPAELAVPALTDALADEEWHVRKAVAEALAVYGEDAVSAVPELINALKDEEWHVRKPATEALGTIGSGGDEVASALIRTLSDEEWQVRNAAAVALVAIPNNSAVSALGKALTDEEWHVAANASMALAEIGPEAEPSVPELMQALKHKEWHVRNNAAYALGLIGSDSAVSSLNALLSDEEPQVGATAREALGRLQGGP